MDRRTGKTQTVMQTIAAMQIIFPRVNITINGVRVEPNTSHLVKKRRKKLNKKHKKGGGLRPDYSSWIPGPYTFDYLGLIPLPMRCDVKKEYRAKQHDKNKRANYRKCKEKFRPKWYNNNACYGK